MKARAKKKITEALENLVDVAHQEGFFRLVAAEDRYVGCEDDYKKKQRMTGRVFRETLKAIIAEVNK